MGSGKSLITGLPCRRWSTRGVPKENGRGLGGHLLLIRKRLDQFSVGVLADQVALRTAMRVRLIKGDDRVAQHREVGAATGLLDRIFRFSIAIIEVRRRCGSEVPAGGEAEDADALGIDIPLLRPRANGANGTLGVVERRGMAVAFATVPIIHNEAGHADGVQPAPNLMPFMIHRPVSVAAAGADDNRGSICLVLLRQVGDEFRLVLRLIAQSPRSTFRPKQHFLRRGLRCGS